MRSFVLIMLVFLLFIACNKETVLEPIISNSMSCNIDGKAWMSDKDLAKVELLFDENIDMDGTQTITGGTISLSIEKTDLVVDKIIPIDESMLNNSTTAIYKLKELNAPTTKIFLASKGSIKITKVSGKAFSGIFNFDAFLEPNRSAMVKITNGKFEMTLK